MVNRLSAHASLLHNKTACGHKKQVFPLACVIEKDVKVNIMRFRTLCSFEFQGSCCRDVNLGQSENCIFGIYDQ